MARKKRRRRTKAVPRQAAADTPFAAGLEAHRSGRLDDAADHYQAAMAADPDDPEPCHLLGVVRMQSGALAEAERLLSGAIALKDDAPAYHDHLGLVLRQMGRLEAAAAAHRRALALDGDFAAAHNNLAGTLMNGGRLDEAEASARTALRLRPGDPETLLNMGQILLAQGRLRGALDVLEAARRSRPDSADVLTTLASAYQRMGRRADAEAAFDQAAAAAPERSDVHLRHGAMLLAIEKFEDAVAAYDRAAALDPEDMGIVASRGIARWRGGDLEAAATDFDAVLTALPGDLSALLGMAAVYSASGDGEAARALYLQALEIDPDNLDVYNNLATEGGGSISDAQAEHLAGLFANRRLADEDRAKAGFALAAYLRFCGEDEAAFDICATANAFRAAAQAAGGAVFDPDVHRRHVEARRTVFVPDFFAARRHMGSDDEAPVFVVGMPRSGTTLVEQILASHNQVFGAGERRDMAEIGLERLPGMLGDGAIYPACLTAVTADQCRAVADQYLTALRRQAPDALRIVDKMPFNFMHLGLVALLFPKARVIHCRRDMRDVALSCLFTNFADSHPWSTRLGDIARFIHAYRGLMAHWRAVLPISILEVDYENLVRDQETESRRLVDHLGLDWDPACLNFHETARPVSTAARAQVRQPLYTSAVGRWRAYAKWLAPLNAELVGEEDRA